MLANFGAVYTDNQPTGGAHLNFEQQLTGSGDKVVSDLCDLTAPVDSGLW
jgi:hypothetical protein